MKYCWQSSINVVVSTRYCEFVVGLGWGSVWKTFYKPHFWGYGKANIVQSTECEMIWYLSEDSVCMGPGSYYKKCGNLVL